MFEVSLNDCRANGINGNSTVDLNGNLADTESQYSKKSCIERSFEGVLSTNSNTSTPIESPQVEKRPRQRTFPVNSLSTARDLGPIPQQDENVLDMICVGFGPASLAIAIALADIYSKISRPLPNVLFIEKQEEFSWHSGMQLPSAKMQISFLKDLATPRDPTSPFTFLNYLHSKSRLNQFINLATFLPTRLEYEDYLRWCADHFKRVVMYGREVLSVEPDIQGCLTQKAQNFHVRWKSNNGFERGSLRARHVVIAAGGEPHIPEEFKPFTDLPLYRVRHSSQYSKEAELLANLYRKSTFLRQQQKINEEDLSTAKARLKEENLLYQMHISEIDPPALRLTKKRYARTKLQQQQQTIDDLEQDVTKELIAEEKHNKISTESGPGARPPRFAIIGNGQSAAEIFSDLWTRFPDSEISMIIKGTALRPSDDSPFVNEIFDPERVDDIYAQSPRRRKQAIAQDRDTNYGVVRLELLEHIYEQIYVQRVQEPEPSRWRCKIITNRKITNVKHSENGSSLLLQLSSTHGTGDNEVLELACEHVFVATGYTRNAYQKILKDTRPLLPDDHHGDAFPVGRDYGVIYDREKVEKSAGVWLQGCNESTHGLSDSLLSILAVRGGEMVQSIFGEDLARESK